VHEILDNIRLICERAVLSARGDKFKYISTAVNNFDVLGSIRKLQKDIKIWIPKKRDILKEKRVY
jgi:uncharacterized protein YpmB